MTALGSKNKKSKFQESCTSSHFYFIFIFTRQTLAEDNAFKDLFLCRGCKSSKCKHKYEYFQLFFLVTKFYIHHHFLSNCTCANVCVCAISVQMADRSARFSTRKKRNECKNEKKVNEKVQKSILILKKKYEIEQ